MYNVPGMRTAAFLAVGWRRAREKICGVRQGGAGICRDWKNSTGSCVSFASSVPRNLVFEHFHGAGQGRDSAFWGGRPVFPRGRVSKGIKGRARNTLKKKSMTHIVNPL